MVWAISLTTMAVRCHCLTPVAKAWVFGVYLDLVGRGDPRIQTVALPPRVYYEAAPKGISKRTSYLRVRLAFHSYTQVIRGSCDTHQFGPPVAFRLPSSCPCIAHPVSGLVPATISALFGLAFAPAPAKTALATPLRTKSLAHYAKGTPSPACAGSDLFVRITFQILFHPPYRGAFHLSLTVLSAIDLCICLALDGGPPGFRPDYTCPTLLRNSLPVHAISRTGLSPSMVVRSRNVLLWHKTSDIGVLQPRVQVRGLGFSLFARHY